MHGPIDVLWASDEYVSHARFSDVFGPLEGVTFFDEGEYTVQDYAPPAEVSPGWERAYAELRPVEAIASAIAVHREALGENYVAIHVRRTDMVPLAEWLDLSLTTDEPDYRPVLTYAKSDDLRKQLYLAYNGRAYPVNEGLLKQVLETRDALLTNYDPIVYTLDQMKRATKRFVRCTPSSLSQ